LRLIFVERADHAALEDRPETLNGLSVDCADPSDGGGSYAGDGEARGKWRMSFRRCSELTSHG
jgi:hypothetical protein